MILLRRQKQILRDGLGDRNDASGPAKADHEVLHLRLEVQTIPQNEVSIRECNDIAAGLTISMRIHSGAHQRLHLNQITANIRHGIRNHACGGNDGQTFQRSGPACGQRHGACDHRCKACFYCDCNGSVPGFDASRSSSVDDIAKHSQSQCTCEAFAIAPVERVDRAKTLILKTSAEQSFRAF